MAKKGQIKWNEAKVITIIANKTAGNSLNFYRKWFNNEGWKDTGFEKWQKRKDNLPHPILKKRGDLYKSLTKVVKKTGWEITDGVPYGKWHNEGGERLPKRPYLYPSEALDRENRKIIDKEIKKQLKIR